MEINSFCTFQTQGRYASTVKKIALPFAPVPKQFFSYVGCHLNALIYYCTFFFQRISFLLYFITVAGVFLIPKLAVVSFVQCRHVFSLNTRIYQLLQRGKTISYFSATFSGFSQEPLRIHFLTHVTCQDFLSRKYSQCPDLHQTPEPPLSVLWYNLYEIWISNSLLKTHYPESLV